MVKSQLLVFLTFISILCNGQEVISLMSQEGTKPIFVALEYGIEAKGNEDINSFGLKLDFAHYHRDRFATSIETKIRRYKGVRSEIENNTLAIGLGYTVKYHFIENVKMSSFVDCGFGAIYSIDRFPSRGTHFNGQYYLGLGNLFRFSKLKPFLALRYFHSSNGRGFVTDNPAYDGLFISTGIMI